MNKRTEWLYGEDASRRAYARFELKRTLLKSLLQDHNNAPKQRTAYAAQRRIPTVAYSVTQQYVGCLITGRVRGNVRLLGLSRQTLKRFALENRVQNLRVGSW